MLRQRKIISALLILLVIPILGQTGACSMDDPVITDAGETGDDLLTRVVGELTGDEEFIAAVKGDKGDQGDPGIVIDDPDEVAEALKGDPAFVEMARGDKGEPGDPGQDGDSGEDGDPGPQGPRGLDCWDLDGNGTCDLDGEDTNGDGECDALDCQGPPGPETDGVWLQDVSTLDAYFLDGNVGVGTSAPDEALSVDGVVESLSGGFKFPDGTTQSTAAIGGGNPSGPAGGDLSGDYPDPEIANGAITLDKIDSSGPPLVGQAIMYNGTTVVWDTPSGGDGWSRSGNAGTAPGTDFVGTTDDQALELHVNSARALRIEPNATSPNLIGGFSGNSVTGGVVAATIGGGGENAFANNVTGGFGTVGGGRGNRATTFAVVAGGIANAADGERSFVGGGTSNNASGNGAAIAGGDGNIASGQDSTVCGGQQNTASAESSIVLGGEENVAAGVFSLAAGKRAKANHDGTFVWGDRFGGDVASSAANQWTVRARGGVRFFTNTDLTTGVQLPSGGGAWQSVSARSTKENFERVDAIEVLHRLAAIPIETWNYKSQDPSVRHIGPMAQDFYSGFGVGEDDRHITTIDADGVALAAIQGLYSIVQDLEATIQEKNAMVNAQEDAALAQRQRIDHLTVRLERMEAIMIELTKVARRQAR